LPTERFEHHLRRAWQQERRHRYRQCLDDVGALNSAGPKLT